MASAPGVTTNRPGVIASGRWLVPYSTRFFNS